MRPPPMTFGRTTDDAGLSDAGNRSLDAGDLHELAYNSREGRERIGYYPLWWAL